MELRLRAHDFPLAFLDPLLADFDDIQGSVTGEINVQGTPEAPVYTGLVSTEDLRFMFVRNRLYYVMSATLQPEGENIRIVSMEIKNDREDRPDGVMVVSGMLTLKEFSVSSFDFSTQGKLLILSERMQKSAQEIQGNLFASIGPEGLHFTGTFDRSRLTGTISIESANILFPAVQQTVYTGSPTSLNYVVVDDTSKATSGASALARYQRGSDTVESAGDFEDGASTRTIFDGVSYDVRIETKGDAEIRMIFDPVTGEELLAVLNGKLAMVRDGQQTQLLGEVTVAERSFYSFYKKFDATGKLKFTGDPENPELDIKAKYEGIYEGQTKDKPDTTQTLTALVDLTITGTRYEPKLEFDLVFTDRDGNKVIPLGLSDPHADAISYLFIGKLKNDLTGADRDKLYAQVGKEISTSLTTGFASSLLSEVLTEYFRNEFGFVSSVELTYRGGGSLVESAELRLSGEIFSAYWRFGGRIFTDPTNANVSVQLSMGDVFNSTRLRNLMLQLERQVRDIQVTPQDKDTYGARLYYRITF